MDLEIVRALQSLQNPALDWFFYGVTSVGDQYAMIFLTAILYWTVDRKFAFRFVVLYLVSAGLNVLLKSIFVRPRPYLEEGVIIPGPEGTLTEGYSFPSGHSQAAGVLGWTGMQGHARTGRAAFRYASIAVLILVPLSRVYLGQHYLTDVIVGAILGYGIAYFGYRVLVRIDGNEHLLALTIVPFLLIGVFLTDSEVATILSGGMGFFGGYALDRLLLDHDMGGSLLRQLAKAIIGFTGVIVLFTLFRELTAGHTVLAVIRYFLIGIWASFGAPVVFAYAFRNHKKTIY
ncbi:MAG: phosphatase PAP2 family protein [Acholeplasmataceae bacterium]